MTEREELIKLLTDTAGYLRDTRNHAWPYVESGQQFQDMLNIADRIDSTLSALTAQQEPVACSDDLAVDRFAAAMKKKLAQKRNEGRSGWDDPKQCSIALLESMLHEHYQKGDVIDLANFCMMLHQRGMPTRWRLTPPSAQYKESHDHMHDLYAALGIKWGDDPFPVIQMLRDQTAPASGVRAGMLRAAEICRTNADVERASALFLASAITRAAQEGK